MCGLCRRKEVPVKTRYSVIILGLIWNAITFQGGHAAENERRQPNQAPNFISQPSFPNHYTWALFLGTGATQDDVERIEDLARARKLTNPFTGQPFERLKVFAFGRDSALGEAARVITDHVEIHLLSSVEEIRGYHLDFVICHSNGCTYGVDAHKDGVIQADNFLALGADWTSKDFGPGDLKGANLYFFIMKGDPIWKIPAPSWARITENTPGFKFIFRGDTIKEILRGLRNLLTTGRADPERLPVVRLDTPPGQRGTFTQPFRPHALLENYFPAILSWMKSEGKLQKQIRATISELDIAISWDEKKRGVPFPPGGGGSGGRGSGSTPHSPGTSVMPSRPGIDPRGGVSAEIKIAPKDFKSK
jgi:hypothetical protein